MGALINSREGLHVRAEKRGQLRHHRRFPCRVELWGTKLAVLGAARVQARTRIRGRTQNISRGGACLLSNRSIPESSLVRCEFLLSGTRAAIPTLMQVRWTQRASTHDGYKTGLRFLL